MRWDLEFRCSVLENPRVEALLGAPCSAPLNPCEPELLASLRHLEACWWARASSTREQFRKVRGGGTPFKYWRWGRLPGGGSMKQEAELGQTGNRRRSQSKDMWVGGA